MRKGFGVFGVEFEEVFEAFEFGFEGGAAVCGINGFVEFAMSLEEFSGHGEWVVQVGEGCIGEELPS